MKKSDKKRGYNDEPVKFPKDISELSVHSVYADLNQPRKRFDLESILELANSILTHGLVKPILVQAISVKEASPDLIEMCRRYDAMIGREYKEKYGKERDIAELDTIYLIVVGQRRFEASWRAGLPAIRSQVVMNLSKKRRLALQIAEDSQERIPEWEVANNLPSLYYLITKDLEEKTRNPEARLPLAAFAVRLGRSVEDVKRFLDYNNLSPRLQEQVRAGKLGFKEGCEIARIHDYTEQEQLAEDAKKENYSLRIIREKVNQVLAFSHNFLSSEAIEQAKEVLEPGSGESVLFRLQRDYREGALKQIRDLLGIKKNGKKNILSQEAIDMILRDAGGLDELETVRYFRDKKPFFSKRINRELEILTYPVDLWDGRIFPKEDDFFINEREAYYNLLNDTKRLLTVCTEICKVDEEARKKLKYSFKEREDLIRGFSDGLSLLEQKVSLLEIFPCGDSAERRYSGKSKGVLSTTGAREQMQKRTSSKIIKVPLSKFIEDEKNVRTTFGGDSLTWLAWNLRNNGQIEPLLVEKIGNRYKIVTGHRRYKACKLKDPENPSQTIAGLNYLRCIRIDELSEIERRELQIIEDSQKAFSPWERASHWFMFYRMLNLERKEKGEPLMSISEFAKVIGKSPSTIRKAISFLTLDDRIQRLVERDILQYSAAVEISYLPQRMESYKKEKRVARNYEFDPENDFYLTPQQILSPGENPYRSLQHAIALRALSSDMSTRKVEKLIKMITNPDSSDTRDLFLSSGQEYLSQFEEENERRLICQQLAGNLDFFPRQTRALLTRYRNATSSGSKYNDRDYQENVFNYPLVRHKLTEVSELFSELQSILKN